MLGITAGLEIARKALSTYQLALNVYGNNIANVDTPGFSRRSLLLSEAEGHKLTVGRIGLGVDPVTIRRMRDTFLDDAYRRGTSSLGLYESLEQNLQEIEMIFGEPGDAGLSTVINEFWNSWQELANQPESQTVRNLVKDKGVSLAQALNQMNTNLVNMMDTIDNDIKAYVGDVNRIAYTIADLNRQIVSNESSGDEAGDLRDQRDLLVDELSKITNITVFEKDDGSISVMLGSEALVERTDVVELTTAEISRGGFAVNEVRLGTMDRGITPAGGKLGGLLESRDTVIPEYITSLDEIARALVVAVNTVHQAGYGLNGTTGDDFFDPTGVTAATINVAATIINDLSLIAASADGTVGNGDNALALGDLRLQAITADGSTIDEYYSSLVGSLGIQSSAATSHREREETLALEIDNRRESVKGVSIDEEMTNLIATQHAYEAAAKLVTVVDELMQSVMQML